MLYRGQLSSGAYGSLVRCQREAELREGMRVDQTRMPHLRLKTDEPPNHTTTRAQAVALELSMKNRIFILPLIPLLEILPVGCLIVHFSCFITTL